MRTYTRKSTRGSVSLELMQKAANAVIKDGRKIKTVAKELDICHMTLYRFVKKLKSRVENIAIGYKKVRLVFTEEQEDILAEYLLKCAAIFFGLLPEEVKKLAYECALKFNAPNIPPSWHVNRKAGPDWLTGFLKRNPHLSIRTPESTSASRATSFNKHNVRNLAEEQSKRRKESINNEEVRKNKGKGKVKTKQESAKGKGKGKGKSVKRQVLQMSESSENEEDTLEYYCLVCCDSYSNSRSGEEWVQCQECKNWAHSRCRQNQDLLTYLCPNCVSDISSDD